MAEELIRQRLDSVDRYDCPWSWDSLTPELTAPLSRALVDWVLDYNDNFVTRPAHLIPKCWPVHRGLAREIAAMYAHWMRAFHHATATPYDATAFYERTLPGFQSRIPGWLGPHPEKCQAGQHDSDWDKDVGDRIKQVQQASQETLRALDGDLAMLLSTTRSAPHEAAFPVDADSIGQ